MNRMSRMLLTVASVLVSTVALGGIFDGMAPCAALHGESCAPRIALCEVAGAKSASPNLTSAWTRSLDSRMDMPSSIDIAEASFAREDRWMLESTRIRVRLRWCHAKVIVPRAAMCCVCSRCAVSVPVDATGGNPKEVEGLLYASAPPP